MFFMNTEKKKKVKKRKQTLFVRMFNKLLKLPLLKAFELSIGFVKGFAVKVEFFEDKQLNKEE